jgi:hypothetical protein
MMHLSTVMRQVISCFTLCSHGMVKNWFIQYARWVFIILCTFLLFTREMLITSIVKQDGYELRKNFLIHVLKCHENEAEENIPAIVHQYLRSIKE